MRLLRKEVKGFDCMMKQPVRTNVSDFIKTHMGSQFVIPVYQRNYTWNPEIETARFINDMKGLLEHRTASHFLGIVIYKEAERAAMFREIQIVDGQQRLTTSFIFLLALKNAALKAKEKETAGMIEDYYLYNRHVLEEARMRLKPVISDDDVYSRLIYGSVRDLSAKEKETPVYRNYDYIFRQIEQLHSRYSLLEILDCLSRMDILAFPLSEDDNSQQIFESINSTGAPLTSADLIRNYILMNYTSDVQERYYRLYWEPLERYLPDSRRLEEFFRYFLAAKTYNLFNRRDVYDGFKEYWNRTGTSREQKLREINRYCRYYMDIYQGPAEDRAVEAALQDYRHSDSRLPAPFLMAMFSLYEDHVIDMDTLIRQIRLMDSYMTRRALCGYDTGSLSRYFPQLLRSVMSSYQKNRSGIHEITKVYLINYNRGRPLAMPTDDQLRSQLKEVNAYSLMCLRSVLERIEHHGATARVDVSGLNIEHIMPQHPNAYWKRAAKAKDEEEYAFYVNLIGNLTLCAEYDNTRMGNQSFDAKKKILSATRHIRMNEDILNKQSWAFKDILERCDRLIEEIIEIYPYEGSHAEMRAGDDIITLNAPTVNAKAIYRNQHTIEVLTGSTMRAYGPQDMKSMRPQYLNMVQIGVLSEDENGRAQFEKNYRFHDLNLAASFLMHRGGNNLSAWTLENGEVFQPEKAGQKEAEAEEPAEKKPAKRPARRRKTVKETAPEEAPETQKRKVEVRRIGAKKASQDASERKS